MIDADSRKQAFWGVVAALFACAAGIIAAASLYRWEVQDYITREAGRLAARQLIKEVRSDTPSDYSELVASLAKAAPGEMEIARLRVAEGMKYRFHEEPKRIGTRFNPKNLDDKGVFDRYNKLKKEYAKSAGETNFLVTSTDEKYMRLTIPVISDGKMKGTAEVVLKSFHPEPPIPNRSLALLFTFIGIVLASLLALKLQLNRYLYMIVLWPAGIFLLVAQARIAWSADSYFPPELAANLGCRLSEPPAAFSAPYWLFFPSVFILAFFGLGFASRALKALKEYRFAYAYIAPTAVGMFALVFFPFVYGIVLAFFEVKFNVWNYVGLRNFIEILSDFDVTNPRNFHYTFAVTMLWTFTNVFLHVTIGLFLALVLNNQLLRFRTIYRVLLILPWAVPNYITALIWRGMFHKEFGAINAFLVMIGFERISWFKEFWTSFSANLITNTWLGFPFMMVISLGALQSIPKELYEAADVDGASRRQKFVNITLPLLKPALFPAIILGMIWTFNMFNIIYLVSGGAPNNSTDILIVEAYRWAFEMMRYGYAAAYSVLIFVVLVVYTLITNKLTKATESAYG